MLSKKLYTVPVASHFRAVVEGKIVDYTMRNWIDMPPGATVVLLEKLDLTDVVQIPTSLQKANVYAVCAGRLSYVKGKMAVDNFDLAYKEYNETGRIQGYVALGRDKTIWISNHDVAQLISHDL